MRRAQTDVYTFQFFWYELRVGHQVCHPLPALLDFRRRLIVGVPQSHPDPTASLLVV